MSINNSILKLLNMEDKNINFKENFVEERKIKNKRCLVILGYLKNDFEYCPCCGCINENTIIKKGTRNSLIYKFYFSKTIMNLYTIIKKYVIICL